jgi:hypothetical protein
VRRRPQWPGTGVGGYLNDARIAVAYSGNVPLTTHSIAPVAGKQIPVVLTAGRMIRRGREIVLAPSRRSNWARRRLGDPGLRGPGTRQYRVTGIGFVPNGPHNGYADGSWVTPAGYQQIFRGARYAYKFRIAEVSGPAGRGRGRGRPAGSARWPARPPGSHSPSRSRRRRMRSGRSGRVVPPVALSGFSPCWRPGGRPRAGYRGPAAAPRAGRAARARADLAAVVAGGDHPGVADGADRAGSACRWGWPWPWLWHQVAETTPLAYHPPLAVWALLLIVPAGLAGREPAGGLARAPGAVGCAAGRCCGTEKPPPAGRGDYR